MKAAFLIYLQSPYSRAIRGGRFYLLRDFHVFGVVDALSSLTTPLAQRGYKIHIQQPASKRITRSFTPWNTSQLFAGNPNRDTGKWRILIMEKKTKRLATSLKFRKRCYSLLEQRAIDCIHCPVQAGWGSRRQHVQGSTEWNTSLPLNTPKRKPALSNFSISHSLYLRSSQCRIFPYQWEPLSSTYPGGSVHILLHVNGAPWSCAVHSLCRDMYPLKSGQRLTWISITATN